MGIVGAFAAAPARSGGATMANANACGAFATAQHNYTHSRACEGRQLGARREGIRSA